MLTLFFLREGLSLAWNFPRGQASLRDLTFASPALGLQASVTIPSLLHLALGDGAQVFVLLAR